MRVLHPRIAIRRLMIAVAAGVGTSGMMQGTGTSAAQDRPPSPALPASAASVQPQGDVLVVTGSAGTEAYGRMFREWAARWERAAEQGDARVQPLDGTDAAAPQKQILRERLDALAAEPELPLWIVFIGHGTFDGREGKFNLVGEDVSDLELQAWLSGLQRPVALINCTSASGAFLTSISSPGRIVVTATKSGQEINFARFGDYMSRAIGDPEADLDRDGQVSLLEAFLSASRQTEEFYAGENRLATEHAQLDDNGDLRGVRADEFDGVRPQSPGEKDRPPDGLAAHQWHLIPSAEERSFPAELRARRNELELAILKLREQSDQRSEAERLQLLEPLLLEMSRLYQQADESRAPSGNASRGTDATGP